MIGKNLAHYEITGLLGKGGMGEVYRARDTKLGRDVALKILPVEVSRDPERAARFEREARTIDRRHRWLSKRLQLDTSLAELPPIR